MKRVMVGKDKKEIEIAYGDINQLCRCGSKETMVLSRNGLLLYCQNEKYPDDSHKHDSYIIGYTV